MDLAMQPVNNFMKEFQNSYSQRNNESLCTLLKNIRIHLTPVPRNRGEEALEIIFNKDQGIFKFIEAMLDTSKTELNQFRTSLAQSFEALKILMETFSKAFEIYVTHARDVCFSCIKVKCYVSARKSAAETLKKLIQLFKHQDMQLNEVITHYKDSYQRLYTLKEGYVLYIVIGGIAKYCPQSSNICEYADFIYKNLLREFKSQLSYTSDNQPDEVKIYIECFADMLDNFEPYETKEIKKKYFDDLYNLFTHLCKPGNAKKTVRDRTIQVFTRHMNKFSTNLFKDYKEWHILLIKILQEKDFARKDTEMRMNALKNFYTIITYFPMTEQNRDTFEYFRNHFMENLVNRYLPFTQLRITIYGIGEFASSYSDYPSKICELFQTLACRISSYYSREIKGFYYYEELIDYIEALSKILMVSSHVSSHQISVLTELCLRFVKNFPKMKPANEMRTNILRKIFVNVSKLEKELQREFFSSFFKEAILWTCSHALSVDVELQQEYQNLFKTPVCYKDYLPMWHSIFSFNNKETRLINSISGDLIENFTTVVIEFIDRLNIRVETQDEDVLFDTFVCLKAKNVNDYRFFINMIDFSRDVLEKVDSDLLRPHYDKLIICFIKYSYTHPLVSGFYKFLETLFMKYKSAENENILSKSTSQLICQYFADVLKLVNGFPGELQLSCIYLILNWPTFFMKDLIEDTIVVFQTAFNIGLSDILLANRALDTLEKWHKSLEFNLSQYFLKNVLLYLEPYLSSEESANDYFESDNADEDSNNSLGALQRKILLFYGSLCSNVTFDYIHEKSIQTNSSWNKKTSLQFELLFPEMRLKINFDRMILHVIDLTKSGDRLTKIGASELLHTLVSVILGERLLDQCFNNCVCNALLRLACDPDDAVKNLYHPLVIQLAHYFSSNLLRESTKAPQIFLDALFDGLTEEFDVALRDHCGLYLKEFTLWSRKQSTNRNVQDIQNLRSINQRIINGACHPSSKKRIAAAVAFNNLYSILRENQNVVNVYWLEFLYVFVKSMDEFNNLQSNRALDHIVKVIKVKSNLFNAKNSNRKKPVDLEDETMVGILKWLFSYCFSINAHCRKKCKELFETLFACLATDVDKKRIFTGYQFNKMALKDLNKDLESITSQDCKSFVRALDVYMWVFKTEYLSTDLVGSMQCEESRLRFDKCFEKFVHFVINIQPDDTHGYNRSCISEMVLEMLDFVALALALDEKEFKNQIMTRNHSLLTFIMRSTLCPWKVDLSGRRFGIIDKYTEVLIKVHKSLNKNSEPELLLQLKQVFLDEAAQYVHLFIDTAGIVEKKHDIQRLQYFIKGLMILKHYKSVDLSSEQNFTSVVMQNKILEVFNILKTRRMNDNVCTKLDQQVVDYLNDFLKFSLQRHEENIINVLVEAVTNKTSLTKLTGGKISHGEYFLEMFQSPIFESMLQHPENTLEIIEQTLSEDENKLFWLIEKLLFYCRDYCRGERAAQAEIMADLVIARCKSLKKMASDNENRKQKFVSVNKTAVMLKKNAYEATSNRDGSRSDFYEWILTELDKDAGLDKQTAILSDFLICLVDPTSNKSNPELSRVLRNLRHSNSTTWAAKLQSEDSLRYEAMNCYKVLLKNLAATKSYFLYEALINFSAGVHSIVQDSTLQDHLSLYFTNLSHETALKSVTFAYESFTSLNQTRERLDVLRYFLLPSMQLCDTSVAVQFYDEKYKEMVSYIVKNAPESVGSVNDRIKLWISKTGCFNLFESIFAKHEVAMHAALDPDTSSSRPINQLLTHRATNVRQLTTKEPGEKEPLRLLHCAALNCIVALVSLKSEEKFYKYIFMENVKIDQFIWERIVDCERAYEFRVQSSSQLRSDKKKLINIRRAQRSGVSSTLASHQSSGCDLASLTLLEDPHAYDLNDAKLAAACALNSRKDEERRLALKFEADELNEHECMAMLSGVLVHMFNSGVSKLPKPGDPWPDVWPDWLVQLRQGFGTVKQPNAQLFLLRLLANTKGAFVPYANALFEPLLQLLCNYLADSRKLNYVVRDALVVLLDSACRPTGPKQEQAVRKLMERLLERAVEPQPDVYSYNLWLAEGLLRLWGSSACPRVQFLEKLAQSDWALGVRALVLVLRVVDTATAAAIVNGSEQLRQLVRTTVEERNREVESVVLKAFEALGHQFRLMDADLVEEARLPPDWLEPLLVNLQVHSQERTSTCVAALYRAWNNEQLGGPLADRFACKPDRVSKARRPGCFELLSKRLELGLAPEVAGIDVARALRESWTGCEQAALRLLENIVVAPDAEHLTWLDEALRLAAELAKPGRGSAVRLDAARCLKRASGVCERWAAIGLPVLLSILGEKAAQLELRTLAMEFWKERDRLPNKSDERLTRALELLAAPGLGSARAFCVLMLELTDRSNYGHVRLYEPLVQDCRFEPYEIKVRANRSGSVRSLGSLAPLFASSFVGHLYRSQSLFLGSRISSSLQIQATMELEFAPTLQDAAAASEESHGRVLPDPADNKLSKRSSASPSFEKPKQPPTTTLASKSSPRFCRSYRIGELPDVEVTHNSLVDCLRQLVLHNCKFSNELGTAILSSLASLMHEARNPALELALKVGDRILQQQPDSELAHVLLEASLRANLSLPVVPDTITKLNQPALGAVMLEQAIIELSSSSSSSSSEVLELENEQPPTKRSRLQGPDDHAWDRSARAGLTSLYNKLGLQDEAMGLVVSGIGKAGHVRSWVQPVKLGEAVLAQAANDWLASRKAFEATLQQHCEPLERTVCWDGLLGCLNKLSNWPVMRKRAKEEFGGSYQGAWEHQRSAELMPPLMDGSLMCILEEKLAEKDFSEESKRFISDLPAWIGARRLAQARADYGEALALLHVCSGGFRDTSSARICFAAALEKARLGWLRSSPLSENQRFQTLLQLRRLQDVDGYLQACTADQLENATRHVLKIWKRSLVETSIPGNDELEWNKRVIYRLALMHRLHEQISKTIITVQNGDDDDDEDEEERDAIKRLLFDLVNVSIEHRLGASLLAMQNDNKFIAKKHTGPCEAAIKISIAKNPQIELDPRFCQLNFDFQLIAAKYKLTCGQLEPGCQEKCKYLINSWNYAANILEGSGVGSDTVVWTQHHLFELTLALKKSIREDATTSSLLLENNFVADILQVDDPKKVFGALGQYGLKMLKRSTKSDQLGKSYAKLAKYCYEVLLEVSDDSLILELIQSVLTGMSLGSMEAAHYFPCLLKPELYANNEQSVEMFIDLSEKVPSWLFLGWRAQILSYLANERFTPLLLPIVRRLVADYPSGIMYTFRQTCEAMPELFDVPEVRQLHGVLFNDRRIEAFIKAICRVCQPEYYLRHHLLQLNFESAPDDFAEAVESLIARIDETQTEHNSASLQGDEYKVLEDFTPLIAELKTMDKDKAKVRCYEMAQKLLIAMKSRLSKNKKWQSSDLKEYSPYLSKFSKDDLEIEIPGQYKSDRKPNVRHHVKISSFERCIQVMDSKCNPIKLSITGDDAKTYSFLVKFGEDLRQDERLQQIFAMTNDILKADVKCKQRYLSVNTYQVIPLNASTGLIQWIEETKSLQEFVEFSMQDKNKLSLVRDNYQRWIDQANVNSATKGINYSYKAALLKYDSKEVATKMKKLVDQIDRDCLRKTLFVLSGSLECFVTLRQNFITSYATKCVVHWLTGVGDRHLQNTLIKFKSGQCFGIDLGLAFGAGIDLFVPELVPFRLTPQIYALLRPSDPHGLFGITMTHVLKALRNDGGSILACLDVFVHESFDWSKYMNTRMQHQFEHRVDVKWLPKKKISTIRKKLDGHKPTTIMLEELSYIHNDVNGEGENKYFLKYENVINGVDYDLANVRSSDQNEFLTPEEQVQCLLDQATDWNVLGRMWSGWCPFV